MAYFPNGTSGHDYEERYCNNCVHSPEDLSDICPIWEAHFMWNYDQLKKGKTGRVIKEVLDMLIPSDKEGFPEECKLFTPRNATDEKYIQHLQAGVSPIKFELRETELN